MASKLEDAIDTSQSMTTQSYESTQKGGRKPLYATLEERRLRNRQAQAAFRERRSKYIKLLEESVRQYETELHNLYVNHRVASDQCQMLCNRNSLLLKVLLEKGIDVDFEISAMIDHTHYESDLSLQDRLVDRTAFQYHSTPVELCPITISNEYHLPF